MEGRTQVPISVLLIYEKGWLLLERHCVSQYMILVGPVWQINWWNVWCGGNRISDFTSHHSLQLPA